MKAVNSKEQHRSWEEQRVYYRRPLYPRSSTFGRPRLGSVQIGEISSSRSHWHTLQLQLFTHSLADTIANVLRYPISFRLLLSHCEQGPTTD